MPRKQKANMKNMLANITYLKTNKLIYFQSKYVLKLIRIQYKTSLHLIIKNGKKIVHIYYS